jgi:glycosyltransferase involved in cell wall biosynthesis
MNDISTIVLAPPKDSGGIGQYAEQLRTKLGHEIDTEHLPLYEVMNATDYVKTAVRAADSDVIHLHFEYGLFRPKLLYAVVFFPVLLFITRLRDVPVIVTLHEVWTIDTVGRVQYIYVWFIHLLLSMTASRLVFMTESSEDDFLPRGISEGQIIPHGVDTNAVRNINLTDARSELNLRSDDTIISQIGYVSRRKGTDDFLELADRHPEYEFVVAGGPLREEDEDYYQRVIELAPENTRVTGVLSENEFHAAFVATDVAILAYRDIRQSGILNWCFAYGVPVVCRAIDRFTNLSEQGAPLVLFGEDDEHPSIDVALDTALADAEERSMAMRKFGTEHDLSHVAEQYINLYQTLI